MKCRFTSRINGSIKPIDDPSDAIEILTKNEQPLVFTEDGSFASLGAGSWSYIDSEIDYKELVPVPLEEISSASLIDTGVYGISTMPLSLVLKFRDELEEAIKVHKAEHSVS
jgi:hypothetical protein